MGKPGSVAATVRKTGSTRFQKAANRGRDNRIFATANVRYPLVTTAGELHVSSLDWQKEEP